MRLIFLYKNVSVCLHKRKILCQNGRWRPQLLINRANVFHQQCEFCLYIKIGIDKIKISLRSAKLKAQSENSGFKCKAKNSDFWFSCVNSISKQRWKKCFSWARAAKRATHWPVENSVKLTVVRLGKKLLRSAKFGTYLVIEKSDLSGWWSDELANSAPSTVESYLAWQRSPGWWCIVPGSA